MTPRQYATAIKKLGLSQVKAGKFLGISPRHSRRIIAGEAEISAAAEKLLRVMIKLGLTVDQVNELAD